MLDKNISQSFDYKIYCLLEKIITNYYKKVFENITEESLVNFFAQNEEDETLSLEEKSNKFVKENTSLYFKDLQYFVYETLRENKDFDEILIEDFIKDVKAYKNFYDGFNNFLFSSLFDEVVYDILKDFGNKENENS